MPVRERHVKSEQLLENICDKISEKMKLTWVSFLERKAEMILFHYCISIPVSAGIALVDILVQIFQKINLMKRMKELHSIMTYITLLFTQD